MKEKQLTTTRGYHEIFFFLFAIFASLIGCGREDENFLTPTAPQTANLYVPLSTFKEDNAPTAPSITEPTVTLEIVRGNGSVGFPNSWLTNELVVRSLNVHNNACSDIEVHFSVLPETMLSRTRMVTTGWQGEASTQVYFQNPGIYIITASAANAEPIAFVVTALSEGDNPANPEPELPQVSNPDPAPNPTPPRGGYVVWLEENHNGCSSGVIHSDYVSINYANKMITFTGADGEVDPGDTVRGYVKVETGYTYEQASRRAPEILRECPE